MKDVTQEAEELVEPWGYIEEVLSTEYKDQETDEWYTEYVYENTPRTHQHILVNTGMENVYLVIVVDISRRAIWGHHLLNLNQKYGLTN